MQIIIIKVYSIGEPPKFCSFAFSYVYTHGGNCWILKKLQDGGVEMSHYFNAVVM
jgi:hypothetical protein